MWYRLYELDGDNHIRKAADLDCADDGEAITVGMSRAAAHGVELWQGSRHVARLHGPQAQTPARPLEA